MGVFWGCQASVVTAVSLTDAGSIPAAPLILVFVFLRRTRCARIDGDNRLSLEHADRVLNQLVKLSLSDNMGTMIESFSNRLAEDLFHDRTSKEVRQFPPELKRAARRKLLYLHDAAELMDLRVPPGNRLEALRGKLEGFYSIRINDQWRIVFRWKGGNAEEVQIADYH